MIVVLVNSLVALQGLFWTLGIGMLVVICVD
jgi:hypothetical protein